MEDQCETMPFNTNTNREENFLMCPLFNYAECLLNIKIMFLNSTGRWQPKKVVNSVKGEEHGTRGTSGTTTSSVDGAIVSKFGRRPAQ